MLLRTERLTKKYRGARGPAVDGADLTLRRGETVGLFGESGSGKSTLGLMVAGLLKPTSGRILLDGVPIAMPYRGESRRRIQILFQHPETSFNPALILLKSMVEPYAIYNLPYSMEGLLESLARYGLYEEHLYRTPGQLSGGELQRAALARILTIGPGLIVLDEPTSMLDVITQVQIINLLKAHQREHGTAYLLVSHNRVLCEKTCDRLYRVEKGSFSEELSAPPRGEREG